MSLSIPTPPDGLLDPMPWMAWRQRLMSLLGDTQDMEAKMLVFMAIERADMTIALIQDDTPILEEKMAAAPYYCGP